MFETIGSQVVARLDDVSKIHGRGPQAVHALRGVSLEFAPHGFTAIMGPSRVRQEQPAARRGSR